MTGDDKDTIKDAYGVDLHTDPQGLDKLMTLLHKEYEVKDELAEISEDVTAGTQDANELRLWHWEHTCNQPRG
jgi:hypothetical protein